MRSYVGAITYILADTVDKVESQASRARTRCMHSTGTYLLLVARTPSSLCFLQGRKGGAAAGDDAMVRGTLGAVDTFSWQMLASVRCLM